MYVENVDVIRLELLQRGLDGVVHRLQIVTRVLRFLWNTCAAFVVRRVLLITVSECLPRSGVDPPLWL